NGAIMVRGRGKGPDGNGGFRIDNNYFDQIQLPHADLEGTVTVGDIRGCSGCSPAGVITGLIDNNTFHDTSYTDGYAIGLSEALAIPLTTFPYWGGHAWNVGGAGRSLGWGSADFIFIEDNLFEDLARY